MVRARAGSCSPCGLEPPGPCATRAWIVSTGPLPAGLPAPVHGRGSLGRRRCRPAWREQAGPRGVRGDVDPVLQQADAAATASSAASARVLRLVGSPSREVGSGRACPRQRSPWLPGRRGRRRRGRARLTARVPLPAARCPASLSPSQYVDAPRAEVGRDGSHGEGSPPALLGAQSGLAGRPTRSPVNQLCTAAQAARRRGSRRRTRRGRARPPEPLAARSIHVPTSSRLAQC